jgi:hypothetical protein
LDIRLLRLAPQWRSLLGEVGIIVLGVLIALSAQQAVEWLSWRDKVLVAEAGIHKELRGNLAYANERVTLLPCAMSYLDALERGILRQDPAAVQQLYLMGPPFHARPWRSISWNAALSTQIADHLGREQLADYGLLYTAFAAESDAQSDIDQQFATAMTARFAIPTDPQTMHKQLAAVGRLRSQMTLSGAISRQALERGWLDLRAAPHLTRLQKTKALVARCQADLARAKGQSG